MICLYAYMQMWYYVSSTYADPGIFANGGGGGGEGGEGVQAEKAPLPGKKTLASYFFVFSPYLQLFNSFTEGGGRFFLVWYDSFRPINNLAVI